MSDVIAAISTALAPAAIGILRLSGEGCAAVAARVFRPLSGRALTDMPERKMVLGELIDATGAVIDRPLAVVSRAPNSYTGEDCCEIHCHGSPTVLTEGLHALIKAGARQALAGEFTRRAFLNGRMDLTAAEAVIDLIEAETAEAARNAAGQLSGAVQRRIDAVYSSLTSMTAHFQAIIDYPDEDIEPQTAAEMVRTLGENAGELRQLYQSFERGKFLKTGLPAAIIGSPNSGKSTLLNALLGYDRAIVTPVAGTTRDTIEERVTLGGVTFRLADTAGIRAGGDSVEKLGMERSRRAAAGAKLCLLLLDGSREMSDSDRDAMSAAGEAEHTLVLINKADLERRLNAKQAQKRFGRAIEISALSGAGLDALEAAVKELFPQGASPQGEVLTNLRQHGAVGRALESVESARTALIEGVTPDAVLSEVELARRELASLTGRSVTDDTVSEIFSRFCVGK